MSKEDDDKEMEDILNDDKIREYFLSRDPNRKKPNAMLDEEIFEIAEVVEKQELVKPKRVEPILEKTPEDKIEIFSLVRRTARRYFWIGISLGLLIAILIFISF